MININCKGCNQDMPHFGKGLCRRCYMKQYMKKNYKKMNITTILIGKDLRQFIEDRKENDESVDATLRRLLKCG